MKQTLVASFILPFRSRQRAILFMAQLAGAAAVSFIGLFLTLDMTRQGPESLSAYLLVRFGLAGFVIFPLLTGLYLRARRWLFVGALLGLQAGAVVLLAFAPAPLDPRLLGAGIGVSSAAYWQAIHLTMAAHTSEAGRGYELSLSQLLMTIGGALGAIAGGWAAAMAGPDKLIFSALALQLIAAAVFCRFIPPAQSLDAPQAGALHASHVWHEFSHHPRRAAMTITEAFCEFLDSILRPAWLHVMGLAALKIGIVHALIVAVQTLIAPWTGKLHAQDKLADIRWGSVLRLLGWAPWTLAPAQALLFCSIPLWAAGAMMVQTGLTGRWYRHRSASAILSREVLLAVIRLLTIWWVLPVMFEQPALFAGLVILAAGLLSLLTLRPVAQNRA